MGYQKRHRIHFDSCDPAGILYFAKSFTLVHQTVESFIAESGIGWDNWFNHPAYAFPIRHADCDYYQPVFAGTELWISLVVTSLSDSTVSFSALAKGDGLDKFQVVTVHTAVAKKTMKKATIPAEIIHLLRQLQEGEKANPS